MEVSLISGTAFSGKKKKVDKVGRTDMKKKYKITQPKPLLLPLRFTEMFQTSEVSYNFIYFYRYIAKCLQKGSTGISPTLEYSPAPSTSTTPG